MEEKLLILLKQGVYHRNNKKKELLKALKTIPDNNALELVFREYFFPYTKQKNIAIDGKWLNGSDVNGGFFAAAAYTTIKKIKDIYDIRVIVLSFVGMGTILPAIFFLLAPYLTPPESLEFLFPAFSYPSSTKYYRCDFIY